MDPLIDLTTIFCLFTACGVSVSQWIGLDSRMELSAAQKQRNYRERKSVAVKNLP